MVRINTQDNSIWSFVKGKKNIFKNIPSMQIPNGLATSDSDIANVLANSFVTNSKFKILLCFFAQC